jgi:hypothetical protein
MPRLSFGQPLKSPSTADAAIGHNAFEVSGMEEDGGVSIVRKLLDVRKP